MQHKLTIEMFWTDYKLPQLWQTFIDIGAFCFSENASSFASLLSTACQSQVKMNMLIDCLVNLLMSNDRKSSAECS